MPHLVLVVAGRWHIALVAAHMPHLVPAVAGHWPVAVQQQLPVVALAFATAPVDVAAAAVLGEGPFA